MRRALLVTVGTVAGLASVLSYSDGTVGIASDLASASDGTAEGLGAPPADEPAADESPSADASTSAKPKPKPSATKKPTAKPSKAAATTQAAAPADPAPAQTSAAPKPAPSKTTAKPTPKPTPTPTKKLPNGDFVGSAVSHKYGTVQVGIRVVDGVITKAWAARYPTGESAPYSEFAIPKLVKETVGTKRAGVAAVSGATLTSKAWVSSLASAMSKAGI
ncbi:MAG: FMN-binding protein [Candidatus Nanopelagicales bacterium]